MRLVFGTGRITPINDGSFGLAFKRLHVPLLLLPTGGAPVPDLAPHTGKFISFQGLLDDTPGNLRTPRAYFTLLRFLPPAEEATTTEPSELTAIVSGNLGNDPAMNPSKDRFASSIPFAGTSRDGVNTTAWIQVACEFARSEGPDAFANGFKATSQGTQLLVAGVLTSYQYKGEDGTDKDGLHITIKGFDVLASGSASKGKTLASAYSPEGPSDGEIPF